MLESFQKKSSSFIIADRYTSDWYFQEERIGINTEFFGSGKTQKAINHYKRTEQKIIIINPTRSLISDVTARFKSDDIQIKNHLTLSKENINIDDWDYSINITLESLPNIDFSKHTETMFIFDEFSTIMNQLFSSINRDRRDSMLECLRHLFRHHKIQVFDALLKDREYDLIKELAGDEKDIGVFGNNYYIPPKRKIFGYTSHGRIQKEIKDVMQDENNNVLLLCDTVRESKTIIDMLDFVEDTSKVNLCSETRQDILNDCSINDFVVKHKPRFMAISPTGFVGLNINEKHFTHVFIIAVNNKIKDWRMYIQAIHRERNYTTPLHIYSSIEEIPIDMKTDSTEIKADIKKRQDKLNNLLPKFINKDGHWITRNEYLPFFDYLVESDVCRNKNKIIGVTRYIIDFYNKYIDEKTGKRIFWIDWVNETEEKIKPKKSSIETKDEKRQRLCDIELISKIDFDKLKNEQSGRDLTTEEKQKMNKFTLSENLCVGYTGIDTLERVNAIYDFSVNENLVYRISKNILAFNTPDVELISNERLDYENQGVSIRPRSQFLEKKFIEKILAEFREKEFDKHDISTELIDDLEVVTGLDFGVRFNDKIINTRHFRELKRKTGLTSLALDYAKQISSGNRDTIIELYKEEIGDLVAKISSSNTFLDSFKAKVDRFIRQKVENFTVSHVKILASILKNWAISIENTAQKRTGRLYKLNTEIFDIYTKK